MSASTLSTRVLAVDRPVERFLFGLWAQFPAGGLYRGQLAGPDTGPFEPLLRVSQLAFRAWPDHSDTNPSRTAYWINAAVVFMPRVCMISYLCDSAVRGEMCKIEATSFIVRPSAINCSTSR